MWLLVFELCPAAFYTAHTEQPQTRCSPRGGLTQDEPRPFHPVLRLKPEVSCQPHENGNKCLVLCSYSKSLSSKMAFFLLLLPFPLFLCVTARAPSFPLNTCVTEHFSPDVMQAGMSVPCTLRVQLLVGHLPSVPLQGLRLKTDPMTSRDQLEGTNGIT